MTAGELISRLDGVRETGPGRWIARCPAHEDRRPSLSVRETDDGTILLHDFGGCSALEVVESIGLEFADRSEEHTSELQSRPHLVCRLLLEKKKQKNKR